MAEYINIRGQSIEVVASDPANPTLGQIWYNSTSNTLKGGGVSAFGSWVTGNDMNTGRYLLGAGGTQTAALAFAGYDSPSGIVNVTEEYDGNSWTNSNPVNTARYQLAGAGTQTAGLAAGGRTYSGTFSPSAATEEYDGNNWTNS
jgi:hypothetical protein